MKYLRFAEAAVLSLAFIGVLTVGARSADAAVANCNQEASGVRCPSGQALCAQSSLQCRTTAAIQQIADGCRPDQVFSCSSCSCSCPSGTYDCSVNGSRQCTSSRLGQPCTAPSGEASAWSDHCGTMCPEPQPDFVIVNPSQAQATTTIRPAVHLNQRGSGLLLDLQANGKDIVTVDQRGLMLGWSPNPANLGLDLSAAGGQNTIYGVAKYAGMTPFVDSLLLLQTVDASGSATDRFRVDGDGNVSLSGGVKFVGPDVSNVNSAVYIDANDSIQFRLDQNQLIRPDDAEFRINNGSNVNIFRVLEDGQVYSSYFIGYVPNAIDPRKLGAAVAEQFCLGPISEVASGGLDLSQQECIESWEDVRGGNPVGDSVILQQALPGDPQGGNIRISGTATVGGLVTEAAGGINLQGGNIVRVGTISAATSASERPSLSFVSGSVVVSPSNASWGFVVNNGLGTQPYAHLWHDGTKVILNDENSDPRQGVQLDGSNFTVGQDLIVGANASFASRAEFNAPVQSFFINSDGSIQMRFNAKGANPASVFKINNGNNATILSVTSDGAVAVGAGLGAQGKISSESDIETKTAVRAPSVCIAGDCRTSWPAGDGAAGGGVQLQSSSPGVQQTGHFNVSGTAKVGKFAVGNVLAVESTGPITSVQSDGANSGPWLTLQGGQNVLGNVALQLYDAGTAAGNENAIAFSHNGGSGPIPTAWITSTNPTSFASNGSKLVLETAGSLVGGVGKRNENQLVLDRSGMVGIGVSTPLEALHINGAVRGNSGDGMLRVQTPKGYVDIGPNNSSWSHFITDRPRFWFNKEVQVDSGLIGSYNEDLQLTTGGTTRITVSDATGNVGIGTGASDKERLSIAGNVYASGVIGNRSSNIGQQMEIGSPSLTTLRFDSDAWRLYAGGTNGTGDVLNVTEDGRVTIGGKGVLYGYHQNSTTCPDPTALLKVGSANMCGVSCDAGEVPLGGGCTMLGQGVIYDSYPSGAKWLCRPSNSSYPTYAFVNCARKAE